MSPFVAFFAFFVFFSLFKRSVFFYTEKKTQAFVESKQANKNQNRLFVFNSALNNPFVFWTPRLFFKRRVFFFFFYDGEKSTPGKGRVFRVKRVFWVFFRETARWRGGAGQMASRFPARKRQRRRRLDAAIIGPIPSLWTIKFLPELSIVFPSTKLF